LMVRKAGTTSFMLPGGKPEAGESAEETIVREIEEELGLSLSRARLRALGTFSAVAANEADHRVIGDVFCYEGLPDRLDVDDIRHLAEIAEAGWFPIDPLPADTVDRQFAPLTRTEVIAALLAPGWRAGRGRGRGCGRAVGMIGHRARGGKTGGRVRLRRHETVRRWDSGASATRWSEGRGATAAMRKLRTMSKTPKSG